MPSIVTITFSPCIDKSTSIPRLMPERKLRCAVPVLEPGGGGINVARAIQKLGGSAVALFPAGGYTGKYFIELLEKERVPSILVETKNETRENIVVRENETNLQYRFVMPGASLSEKEAQLCLQIIQQLQPAPDYIVASGSLPPGAGPARCSSTCKNRRISSWGLRRWRSPSLPTGDSLNSALGPGMTGPEMRSR